MSKAIVPILLLAVSAASPRSARASVEFCDVILFPSCIQDAANCEFDLDYGVTGTVRVLGALHVAGQGTLINPQIEPQTDLTLACNVSGIGTSQATVEIEFKNTGVAASPHLTYFATLNPDGNATSTSMFLNDVPTVTYPPAMLTAEPDAYGIDDLLNLDDATPGNIWYEIFNSAAGSLLDNNYCGPWCDVVVGLEWDLGVLQAGELVSVSVTYSDSGAATSSRFVTAARADDAGAADDPNTVLVMSGIASPVTDPNALAPIPLLRPGALLLFGFLLGWAALAPRFRSRR